MLEAQPQLTCPVCSAETEGVNFNVRYIFVDGIRHVASRTWIFDCLHEVDDEEVLFVVDFETGLGLEDDEDEDEDDCCDDDLEDWEVKQVWQGLAFRSDSMAVAGGAAQAKETILRWKDLRYVG